MSSYGYYSYGRGVSSPPASSSTYSLGSSGSTSYRSPYESKSYASNYSTPAYQEKFDSLISRNDGGVAKSRAGLSTKYDFLYNYSSSKYDTPFTSKAKSSLMDADDLTKSYFEKYYNKKDSVAPESYTSMRSSLLPSAETRRESVAPESYTSMRNSLLPSSETSRASIARDVTSRASIARDVENGVRYRGTSMLRDDKVESSFDKRRNSVSEFGDSLDSLTARYRTFATREATRKSDNTPPSCSSSGLGVNHDNDSGDSGVSTLSSRYRRLSISRGDDDDKTSKDNDDSYSSTIGRRGSMRTYGGRSQYSSNEDTDKPSSESAYSRYKSHNGHNSSNEDTEKPSSSTTYSRYSSHNGHNSSKEDSEKSSLGTTYSRYQSHNGHNSSNGDTEKPSSGTSYSRFQSHNGHNGYKDDDEPTASSTIDSNKSSPLTGNNGLRNIGNTCFMNSVLQCLSNTKPLLDYITRDEYSADINTTTSSMKGALIKAYAALIKNLWKGERRTVDPSSLKSSIQRYAPRFSGYNQEDSQEFLRYLLEGLHEDVNRVTTKPASINTEIDSSLSVNEQSSEAWRRYVRREDSQLVDQFVGQLKSTLKCSQCGYESVTFEAFWDISLPIPGRTDCTLRDCFDAFTKEEVMDGDEMPTCEKCKARRKCTKWYRIYKFPKILVIHLKRFSPNERQRSKLSAVVNFPLQNLDLGNYTDSATRSSFNCYAVSNHTGSLYSGHYTATAKNPHNGNWYHFDDSRVSKSSSSSVISNQAYLLFFELL